MTTTTTASASETSSAVLRKFGKFEIVKHAGLSIPDKAEGQNPSALALPFGELFGELAAGESYFVPLPFFSAPKADGGRGIPQARATLTYARDKIRGSIKQWVERKPDERGAFAAVLVNRRAGQEAATGSGIKFDTDGVSVFKVAKTPSAPPAAAAAEAAETAPAAAARKSPAGKKGA